jgi:hypothetical protein
MGRFLAEFPRRLFLLAMFAGAALITWASLVYFDPDEVAPFVIERLPVVRFSSLWLAALKLHVASALFSFPLCLLLSMRWLQRRPNWHRWLGRIVGAVVLFGLVPTGAVLAFDAVGGAGVTAGFLLSGGIIAVAMVRGVQFARRRDLAAHSYAMRHVLAQMSVAVTSRALLIGLDYTGMHPELAYVVALWVPVIFSAAIVELRSRRIAFSFSNLFYNLQRIHHVLDPHPIPVRIRSAPRSIRRAGR